MRGAFFITFCLLFTATSGAEDLPNFLWITSEDNGPHLGCYGDDYAVTPNLDALAARGMFYTNAISNAPVCAPARTTIISGLYPPSTGAEHMRSYVHLPPGFRMYPQFLRDAGYYCTNNSKEDYNLAKPGPVWDTSNRQAHWKNRKDGQPFFAIFNHTISHESQLRNAISDADRLHDPAQARLPAYHPDTPEVRRNWAQYYDRLTMLDTRVGKNLKELDDAGLTDDTIIFYYGDHGSGMPRSKRWPYNSGLNVPLIVYFPKKWQHLAPHDYKPGGSSDRLVGFIDLAPTVLSLAGIKPPGWMQGGAFAGKYLTEEPAFSYGFRGRMDERYDLVRTIRDKRYVYIRNYMPHRIYGQHVRYMFVTQTTQVWHRLFHEGKLDATQSRFWRRKPVEELYDLKTDPDEVNNLADLPEHRAVLTPMREALRDWTWQIKDVGFLSEWELHNRSEGTTPYQMGHDATQYDFESIFEAAHLASSGDYDDLPEVVKLMGSQDSGVRYWAAVGMLVQGRVGVTHAHDELTAALQDESPMVRITAAEALGRYGSDEDARTALEVLLKYAAPEEDVFLGIAAWNALDYLDERARPVADAIAALSARPKSVPPRTGDYAEWLKQKVMADLDR